jgi:small-conductance mechanosensitive channel
MTRNAAASLTLDIRSAPCVADKDNAAAHALSIARGAWLRDRALALVAALVLCLAAAWPIMPACAADQTVAAETTAARHADPVVPARSDEIDRVADTVEELASRSPAIVRSLPELPAATAAAWHGLDRSESGGRTAASFGELLLLSIAVLVAVDLLVGLALRGSMKRLIGGETVPAGMTATLGAAGLEFLRPLAVAIASRVLLRTLFGDAGPQTLLAASVLDAVVAVVVIRFLLEVLLRPGWPPGRLVPVEDGQAVRLKTGLTAVAVLARVGQVWAALLTSDPRLPGVLLVTAFVIPVAYAWLVWTKRDVFGTWLGRLFGSGSPGAVSVGTRFWVGAMGIVVAIVLLLRLYAALADRPEVPFGTMATVTAMILLLFGETLVRWVQKHPEASTGRSDVEARLLRSGARLARVIMIIAAAGYLARVWLVDALALVPADEWPAASRHWWFAGATAFAGFLAWEVVNFVSGAYLTPAEAEAPEGAPALTGSGSRIRTLVPLLRAAMLALIVVVFSLAVLAMLGVNITPLVAGASILGLAISFGSQTLVRDIITGVFYLAEDAFRVGEYIDCGKAKGTVEGFALRSLRLRHQSGQLHTIPFGQLGQVTNFSRDWSTIKINMRFARDTDLEALRKATKKISQQILDETDYAPDFIDPLKMQGVSEILDDALVITFKFTVTPRRPSEIQREAVRRLLTQLPAAGIRFAAASPTYIQVALPGDMQTAPAPRPDAATGPATPVAGTAS